MAKAWIQFLYGPEDADTETELVLKGLTRITTALSTTPFEQYLARWRIRHQKASIPLNKRRELERKFIKELDKRISVT